MGNIISLKNSSISKDQGFNLIIKKPGQSVVIIISLVAMAIIGLIDYISGYEISFSIFYLLPISFAILFYSHAL
ncbi:MAG: hypothetical protein A2096_06135 [Spirochaetes bacterium GWF1_41_5]|nr:MAG: hypothetical protein A2096_06135 [Spirochaetes bacterium GWF1_41_5]